MRVRQAVADGLREHFVEEGDGHLISEIFRILSYERDLGTRAALVECLAKNISPVDQVSYLAHLRRLLDFLEAGSRRGEDEEEGAWVIRRAVLTRFLKSYEDEPSADVAAGYYRSSERGNREIIEILWKVVADDEVPNVRLAAVRALVNLCPTFEKNNGFDFEEGELGQAVVDALFSKTIFAGEDIEKLQLSPGEKLWAVVEKNRLSSTLNPYLLLIRKGSKKVPGSAESQDSEKYIRIAAQNSLEEIATNESRRDVWTGGWQGFKNALLEDSSHRELRNPDPRSFWGRFLAGRCF